MMERLRPAPIILALAVAALACNAGGLAAAEPTPTVEPSVTPAPSETAAAPTAIVSPTVTPTVPIVHTMFPSDPPPAARYMTDRSSAVLAGERRSIGDDFSKGIFERPFTPQAMDYKGYLDLTRGEISASGVWLYVTLLLEGSPSAAEPASYGVEIDLDLDGRGDWLITGSLPGGSTWTTDGVRAFQDGNNDVGGQAPVAPEPPTGLLDGYETLVFDQGIGPDSDAAWVRLAPLNPNHVQIAFKQGLIGADNEFHWWVWSFADSQPAWHEYQDHFTLEQAGSPLTESPQYPIKELALIDSTCRWGYDFNPVGNEPGVCPVPPTASIAGQVTNLGGAFSGGTVHLGQGSCSSTGYKTASIGSGGHYSFTALPAGTYCVTVDTSSLSPSAPYGWDPVNPDFPVDADPNRTVTLANNEAKTGVNFAYVDVPG